MNKESEEFSKSILGDNYIENVVDAELKDIEVMEDIVNNVRFGLVAILNNPTEEDYNEIGIAELYNGLYKDECVTDSIINDFIVETVEETGIYDFKVREMTSTELISYVDILIRIIEHKKTKD